MTDDATNNNQAAGGVAAAAVNQASGPGSEYRPLDIFIGKWMTIGKTYANGNMPAVDIFTTDIYEWVAGRFFIVHTAFGLMGENNVGGIEMIGYDSAKKQFHTRFYDSQGNISTEELSVDGNTWKWVGASVRCTGVLETNNGATKLVCRHERLDADGKWVPSMDVTLTKVD